MDSVAFWSSVMEEEEAAEASGEPEEEISNNSQYW